MRVLAVGLVGSAALFAPRTVGACTPDFCANVPRWEDLGLRSVAPVPLNGAFVFHGEAGRHDCLADLEPHIAVEVRLGDEVVAGAMNLVESRPGLIVWRPAESFEPAASYDVHVEIDNEAIRPGSECGPGSLQADFEVTTMAGPGPSPPVPTLTGEYEVHTGATGGLATLACCPGVSASYEVVDSCGGKAASWEEGKCAYVYERTYMFIKLTGSHPLPPELAGQVVYEQRFDGEPRYRSLEPDPYVFYPRNEPTCATLAAVSLAGGPTLESPPVCFGQDIAEQLGVRQVDVAAKLDCVPQICAAFDEHTDPEDCQAYDPADPPPLVPIAPTPTPAPECPAPLVVDDGCGCTQAPSRSWLLVPGLLMIRRRRVTPLATPR